MNKEETYRQLLKEAKALLDSEVDYIANMANIAALIQSHFNHHWVGFYRVVKQELQLGPFQGPVACNRIGYGKGVCGTAWALKETQVVDDVNLFPGHIACSPYAKSEIVVPCLLDEQVFAVLDIDSSELKSFDSIDKSYLEALVQLL